MVFINFYKRMNLLLKKKAAHKPLFIIYKSLPFKNRKRDYLFVHCRIKHLEKIESEIGWVCINKEK